jgi:hypothetical protein
MGLRLRGAFLCLRALPWVAWARDQCSMMPAAQWCLGYLLAFLRVRSVPAVLHLAASES